MRGKYRETWLMLLFFVFAGTTSRLYACSATPNYRTLRTLVKNPVLRFLLLPFERSLALLSGYHFTERERRRMYAWFYKKLLAELDLGQLSRLV